MADFKKAFAKTDLAEGGYANDPADQGGETFRGISRVYNPQWRGWPLIDKHKTFSDFSKRVEADPEINSLVEPFYKSKYWDPLSLGLLRSDFCAFLIYDAHVNHGGIVAFWVQKILNVMNQGENLWKDLLVDGVMGPVTVQTLNRAIEKSLTDTFIFCFEALRGAAFIDSTEKRLANEKFFLGWIGRMKQNESYQTNY